MIRSTRGRLVATLFSFAGAALVAGCDTPAQPVAPAPSPASIPPPKGGPGAPHHGQAVLHGEEIKTDAAELRKDAGDKAGELKKDADDKATQLKKEAGEAAKKLEQKGSELKKEAGEAIKKGEEAVGRGLDKLEKKLEGQPK